MPDEFKDAFEKNALIGKMVTGLVSRAGKMFLGGARKAGSYALKNPLGAAGTGAGVAFGAMEAKGIKDKVTQHMSKSNGTMMKSPSFHSYRG